MSRQPNSKELKGQVAEEKQTNGKQTNGKQTNGKQARGKQAKGKQSRGKKAGKQVKQTEGKGFFEGGMGMLLKE